MLTIDLVEEVPFTLSQAEVEASLTPVLNVHTPGDRRHYRLELVSTTDERIRALNAEHRQLDEVTDVLSFPVGFDQARQTLLPASDEPYHLGTIVISVAQAQRQIGHFGPTLKAELLGLAEHGLRHLLGDDHDDEGNWQQAT